MKQFSTYEEWLPYTMYGDTLIDALKRTATLKRPDFFKDGVKIIGEKVTIAKIIGEVDITAGGTVSSSRGADKNYQRVLFEGTNGKIYDLDAKEEKLILNRDQS